MSLLFQGTPDTGGGPGEQLLLDTFTDVDNILLQNHTADTGQTWEVMQGELGIYTNALFMKTAGTGNRAFARSSLSTTSNYKTISNIKILAATGDTDIALNYLDGDNFWHVQVYKAFGSPAQTVIDTVTGGVFTQRAVSAGFSTAGLSDYDVTCELVGDTLTVYFNDNVLPISYTWASAPNANRVGVGMSAATNVAGLNSFQVISL